MFHVLQVSTGYSDGKLEAEEIIKAGGTHSLIASTDPADIAAAGRDANGLLVTLTNVPGSLMEQMTNLKVIVRAGIGVDNIDLDTAKRKHIRVYNLPHYCQDEVADHTVALLLCLERKLYSQVQDVKRGVWNPARVYKPIRGLQGACVGFLGCGGIARRVAARLHPFGVQTIGYDPYLPKEIAAQAGIQLMGQKDVIAQANYLSLHMPLTEKTRQMINAQTLSQMKQGAFLINSARAGLVDHKALYQAIVQGHLGGAALDVVEGDIQGTVPFKDLENVLITPHSAYYSAQADVKIRAQAGELFAAIIRGEEPDSRIV